MEPCSRPEREISREEALRLLGRSKPAQPRRSSVLTTVLAALFLAGVAYGAALVRHLDGDTVKVMDSITRGFLLGRAVDGFWKICFRALVSGTVLLAGVFLCGFSAAGQPFAVFLLLFRGVGLGISTGYFYSQMGGKGVLLAMGMLLPSGALAGYALLLACREALKLSCQFFRAMTAGTVMGVRTFRVYGVKFLILLGMEMGAALLDGVCARVLAPLAAQVS